MAHWQLTVSMLERQSRQTVALTLDLSSCMMPNRDQMDCLRASVNVSGFLNLWFLIELIDH